jgi:hypothetical protein
MCDVPSTAAICRESIELLLLLLLLLFLFLLLLLTAALLAITLA